MSCVLIDVKFGFLIRRAKLEPTVLNSQFVTCCRSSIFVMLRLSLPLASMCSLLSSYVCDLLALCFVLVCSPPPLLYTGVSIVATAQQGRSSIIVPGPKRTRVRPLKVKTGEGARWRGVGGKRDQTTG